MGATNAAANRIPVEVRYAGMSDALAHDDRFALVLADPPYVPTRDVARYPDDPRHAIDGGADGLDVVRTCLAVIAAHASPGAPVALQVRGPAQVDRVTAVVGREGLPLTARAGARRVAERAVLVLRAGRTTRRRVTSAEGAGRLRTVGFAANGASCAGPRRVQEGACASSATSLESDSAQQ